MCDTTEKQEATAPEAPKRVKRPKPKSRPQRWADAAGRAREALDQLHSVKEQLDEALSDLQEVQQEYSDWKDNLPENLQCSPLGEKLDAVCEICLEQELDISEIEEAVDSAENAELPQGFGRD